MLLRAVFQKPNPIKEKDSFNLIFASGLLAHHILASPDQTAIFQLPAAGHVDPFDDSRPQTLRQLAAIHPIPLLPSLFVLGRHIRRVDHGTVNPLLHQLVMDPKPTIPRFVDRTVLSPWKVMLQVLAQCFRFRRLAKGFVLPMPSKNADTPAFFVHIQPDVNRLTREIKLPTLIHGKSPFLRLDFVANKIVAESLRLAFVLLNPFRKQQCLCESYPQGIESGEISARAFR
jgi:hypothetical protein